MSPARGGDEILMFCDRVEREDIEIIFYEEEQGLRCLELERTWECIMDHENWKSMLVHQSYAISYKIPSYPDPNLEEARQVFIQLYRPSDDKYGKPVPFKI